MGCRDLLEDYYSIRPRGVRLKEVMREVVRRYDAYWLLPRSLRSLVSFLARIVPEKEGLLGPLRADGGLYSLGVRGIVGVIFYDNPVSSWKLGEPPFFFATMRLEVYDEYAESAYREVAQALGADNIVITCDGRVFVVTWWRGGADTWGLWRPLLPQPREKK